MTTYQHAIHLHGLGFSLIPISSSSKRPVVKWKRYQTERCTVADLREWFGRMSCRIGIVTGELSSIVAVDCDDLDAAHTFVDAMLDGTYPAVTTMQQTKRGFHFIFRHPGQDTRNGRGFLGANIDVRGDGGYILAYEHSSDWTWEDLESTPVYQPLTRESVLNRTAA